MSQYWFLYILAILAFGYAALKYSQRPTNSIPEPPAKKQLEPLRKNMTLQQLKNYGPQSQRVLLALRGIIYDVSTSDFYTKDGAYSVFSGHDASVNLAKMSHDKQLLNKYWSYTLDRDQQNVLNDWVSRFQTKYPVVGQVVNKPEQL